RGAQQREPRGGAAGPGAQPSLPQDEGAGDRRAGVTDRRPARKLRRRGSMSDQLMTVYIDFLPNQPKNDQSREEIAALLKGRFEQRLPAAVDRNWDLPAIMLSKPSD